MRGRSWTTLAVAATVLSVALQASPLSPPHLFITGPNDDPIAGQDIQLLLEPDNTIHAHGVGNGYSWSISGDADPILLWSFGATDPGHYSMLFFMPVVPGTYNLLRNIASISIADIGGGTNPTSVSNIKINGQVPDGVNIPGVFLGASMVTVPNTVSSGQGFGPLEVGQFFDNPAGMQVTLEFDLVSLDLDGSATFSGQLLLNNVDPGGDQVPEPGPSILIGLGLMGVAALRPRKKH